MRSLEFWSLEGIGSFLMVPRWDHWRPGYIRLLWGPCWEWIPGPHLWWLWYPMSRWVCTLHRSRENSTVGLLVQIRHVSILPHLCHLSLFPLLKYLKMPGIMLFHLCEHFGNYSDIIPPLASVNIPFLGRFPLLTTMLESECKNKSHYDSICNKHLRWFWCQFGNPWKSFCQLEGWS